MIDFKSHIDVTSRMSPGQARKVLAEIFYYNPNLISFTGHARTQMLARDIKTGDILNVLKGGHILDAPEYENGSFRYRVQTARMTVVVAFKKPQSVIVVTAWRE